MAHYERCSYCAGLGYVCPAPGITDRCPSCGGSGTRLNFLDDIPKSNSNERVSRGGGGPGLIQDWVSSGKEWVDKLWPLKMVNNWGKAIAERGWKIKGGIGLLGGILANSFWNQADGPVPPELRATLSQLAGDFTWLVAIGLGVFIGWMLLPIFGGIIMAACCLVGMAIQLTIFVVVVGLIYMAGAMYFGWPPFDQTSSVSPPNGFSSGTPQDYR